MAENFGEQFEKEKNSEAMLDILESAFEKKAKVELTVLEPNGELRTSEVFVEGMEGGILFVSASEKSPVLGIPIDEVKSAKLGEEKEN